MFPTSRFLRILAVALTVPFAADVDAQTIFWDGSASNNWGAANWQDAATGGAAASFANGSDVVFTIDGGGANLSTTLGANRTINSLTVNASLASALTIAGNRLTINGGGMDLSLAGAAVTITSDITVNANQTWTLTNGGTLTVDNDIDGTARTLIIDGSGGATLDMGQTANNGSNIGTISLSNGTTLITTADNQFDDYWTVVNVEAGSTYDRNTLADALSGISGDGAIMNFSSSTVNRDLDIRPRDGAVNVFSGTLDVATYRDVRTTAGAGQRDLVIGTQVFEMLIAPDRDATVYNGEMSFANVNGALGVAGNGIRNLIVGRSDSATSSVFVPTLTLDSSTANHASQDRLPDAELLNMRGGSQLRVIGNDTVLTTETVGTFELERSNTVDGRYIITLDDNGAGVALTSSDLLRANTGSTVLFRGEGLGTAAAGAGVTNLIFTADPTLTTAGSGTGTGVNILPFGIGDLDPTGDGTDFVTYGTNGVRLLSAGEYAAGITSGANVELTASPTTLGGSVDALALKLNGAAPVVVDLGGNTLDVQNGAILSTGVDGNSITNGTVTFGSETEGFLHAIRDFTLAAEIADNGAATSFTKSGSGELTITTAQTYTGNTSVTDGTLTVIGNDMLQTNRLSLEGTLNVDDASTASTSIGMLAGSARGEINLGDNALEINGGGGSTSYFGTLNGSASATLTKSGGNTFSWRSNNNLAITPFAGTVNITGGTFEIRDVQGRFDTASAFNVSGGGLLELDNNLGSTSNNQGNRVGNTAPITLDRGNFTIRASQGVRSTETVGAIAFNSSWNIVSLDADNNATAGQLDNGDVVLIAADLTRANNATGLVRGDNLGFAIGGDAAAGAAVTTGGFAGDPGGSESNFRITNAPTLSHAELTGSNQGVIPWLIGGGTAGNGGNTLVTYDATRGITLLDIAPTTTDFSFQEFAAAGVLSSATIGGQNSYIDFTANNSDASLDGDTTVRALVIDNTGGQGSDLNLAGFSLAVESGVILSTGNQNNQILVGGEITFGNNAATGYEGHIRGTRTIVIDSPIVDNGANPVSVTLSGNVQLRGDNTFTGPLTVNTGRNYIYAANGSTNRIVDTVVVTVNGNGILSLNASDETIGGLEGTGGQGIIENYNNGAANDSILTINNAGDHVFEGIVRDGRAAPLLLVKDGVGSQTITGASASTYTGATSLMDGTLVLGGGLTNRIPDTQVITFGDAVDNTSGVLVLGDGLGALDQTLAGIVTVGTGAANHIVGGSAEISTLTLNQAANDSIAGNLGGAAGNEGNLSFVKNDVGELTVIGTTTLAGSLTVNGGILTLTGAGDVDGPVTVAAGANILNVDGAGLLGSNAAPFTVGDGAALNFRNGSSTQTFAGTGNVLSLDGTGGTTVLGFGVDGTSNDQITLATGQTLSLLGTVNADIYVGGAPTAGMNYTLIDSADDGSFTGGGSFQIGAIFNGGNNIYDVVRETTGADADQLILTVTAVNIDAAEDAWWNGDINNFWGALNTGGDSNWNTSVDGGVDAKVGPDFRSIVHFATTTPAATNLATILDSDTTIEALVFHANSGAGGASISPNTSETLTIGNGSETPFLTVETGGNDAISITAPLALGASQSWNIQDASSVLTIGGGISGTGDLTLNDNGTATGALLFNGAASSFAGALNVNGGMILFEDTGSLSSANDVTLAAGTSIQAGTATMEATSVITGGLISTGGNGSVVGGSANNSTLIFTPVNGDTTYTGSVGGAGANENNLNLVKDGTNTQVLDGAVTHAGTTLVQEGTLQFGSSSTFTPGGAISVIAEDGVTASLDINGQNFTTVGQTTLGGLGTTATSEITDTAGTGQVTLGAGITYDATNDPLGATVAVAIAMGGASRTITVNDSASTTTELTLAGPVTETGNFRLTLNGTGSGRITGPVTLAPSGGAADLQIDSIGGTWTVESQISVGDDFNINDGTLIVATGGQLGTATGDDLLINNDSDTNLAFAELNAVNSFVGDDLFVRSGGGVKLGIDGALVDAGGTAGMDDLNVGDAGLVIPGGSIFDVNGFNSGVNQIVLGGRLNAPGAPLLEGNIINTGGSRTNTLDTSGTSTFRFGTFAANMGGSGVLRKEWYETVTLSGANTRTGNTEVRGGNLILDFSTAAVDTESRIASGNALLMGRDNWRDAPATLTVNGHATFDMTQAVASTNFRRGGNTIDVNSAGGAMNLALGAITQGLGATANFQLPSNGSITTSNADGFLGGWAVVEGGAFADVTGGAIGALSSTVRNDLSTWMTGEHVINDAGYMGTLDCGIVIQSLTFNAATASTVQVNGSLDITSGGILVTGNAGANASTISGGPIRTGGGAFYVHQHNTDPAGLLEISADLTGGSTLSKSGDGELLLSGTGNDLGTVYLHEGTLRVTGGDALADNQRLYILDGATTVFEVTAGQSETIGILDGGVLGQATIQLNAGSSLTVNQTSSASYGGAFAGDGTLIKEGGGNLNYNGVTDSFTGTIIVEDALFQISNIGRIGDVGGITLNKGGTLLLDNDGGTRTGDRVGNNTPITLNSADGAFSGGTVPRGLSIRTNQNAGTNEDVGVINILSGASYASLETDNGGTASESQIVADNFVRTAGATLNVRGRALGTANNVVNTQLRINNATNQTNFINAMTGGAGAAGTTNQSIVPWAMGETFNGGGVPGNVMGNSLMTYVSGRGFTALDLATDYATFTGSSDATDNVRESITTTDVTGLASQTVNAVVIHNDNTAASTINVTGAGAGATLTNTSGTFLFTQNTGADASSAHSTILGGFDDGIATSGSEYTFFVVDPSSAANTATTTAQIGSPLISTADIVKSGRGDLVFTSANTAGGGANRTVINEGAIEVTALEQIGGLTGGIHLAGGTLRIGAGFTDDLGGRAISMDVGGGILNTNGVDVAATDLALSGTGDFKKAGLGILTITGTPVSGFTGTTIIEQGELALGTTAGANPLGTGDVEIRPISFGGSTVTLRNLANDQIDDSAVVKIFNVGGGAGQPSGGRWEVGAFTETVGGIEMTSASGSATKVTVDAGGTLTVTGDIILNNNRGGTGTNAEMVEITGAGALDLGGAARTISVNSTATADGTDAGIETIIQNGGIVKTGEHILYLENAGNTYAGKTVINEGTVSIADSAHLGADLSGNSIELRNGGVLRSAGASVVFSANRSILLDGSGGQIEIAGATTNDLQIDSIVSGHDCAPLTKLGEGSLTLTQANTYEGGTIVSGGTLLVNNTVGSGTGIGGVTVQTSTILGGSGIVSGGVTVESGGTIAAGNSIDMLTVGSLTLDAGSIALFELGGATTTDAAGVASFVTAPGSFVVPSAWTDYQDGVTLHDHILITGGAPAINGTVTLALDSYTPVYGDVFQLFDWVGLGSSDATGTPLFSLPTLTGLGWNTDLLVSHGVVVVAPEPSRFLLLCLAGLGVVLRRRRRN